MADVYSNDPVIKVEKRTFAVTQRAGDELVINRFEKEVVTLREVIASFSLLHRGVVIKELSSYCDTTGYMSAIESAACDIPDCLRRTEFRQKTRWFLRCGYPSATRCTCLRVWQSNTIRFQTIGICRALPMKAKARPGWVKMGSC